MARIEQQDSAHCCCLSCADNTLICHCICSSTHVTGVGGHTLTQGVAELDCCDSRYALSDLVLWHISTATRALSVLLCCGPQVI
jgi:hypothetical protein